MMNQHRCTICTEYVNCRRRKGRKRKCADFEDEYCNHSSPAVADVGCGSCDKTLGTELEILRRNVRFLADCHSTAPTARANEYPIVKFVINEGEEITAHRSILAGVSPVFDRMFSVHMLEKQTGKIHISDASLSTMQAMVNYCYTADITFSVETDIDEITYIAQKYEISSLKDRCETQHCNRFLNAMKVTVDLSTALAVTEEVLATAEKYEMERLRKACVKELHLRNYILKQNCELDRPRKAGTRGHHSPSYQVNDRTSPRTLAKMIRLSFKVGTEGMQDEIYRTVQGLSDEEGKLVWMEVIKSSFAPKGLI